jgi:hypothetical protein
VWDRSDVLDYPEIIPEGTMLLIFGLVLLAGWLLGFLILKKTVGWLFHILLIIAIIVICIHFLGGLGTKVS